MIKNFYNLIITLAIIGSSILVQQIFAKNQDAANIQYPVAELGNCQNQMACKTYCDNPDNLDACLAFAEKNNLMSKQELDSAKKFATAGGEGPGGCQNKDECENYCNNTDHIDECITYAEDNNLIPIEELEEAKKVQAAIKRGVKPPPCGNKKQCDAYCEEADHMEECITFGKEAGFIQGKELEDAQKMLIAVKRGVKAPPCKGKEACDAYCQTPENMEICMNFAMEAGFMGEQEKADAQKMLTALKKGVKPPACNGKEACDAYCGQEEHFEECMNFAEAAGFMTAEDAVMARKTGGKGPGGCMGKEECEAFCNNPDNQETCFNFAKDNGLIKEEDLKQMKEGKQQLQKSFNQMPPAVLDCLNSLLGADMVEKLKNGSIMPQKEMGDQMKTCFKKNMGPQEGQMPAPCKTPEECKSYCENNSDKCQNGQPIQFQHNPGAENPGGQMMPPQAGPGGCKGPEECQAYCENNPNECANFRPNNIPVNQQQPGQEGIPPQGQIPNEGQRQMQAGPGGCQTPEECQTYCQSNPQACGAPSPNQMPEQQPYQNEQMPPQGQMPPEGTQYPYPGNQPGMGMPGQPSTEGNMPYQYQQQMPPQGEYPYQGEQQYQQPPTGQTPPPGYTPPPGESAPTSSAYPTLGQFFGGILYFIFSPFLN